MDHQLNQPKPGVHKTDRAAMVVIYLGLLFRYIGNHFKFFTLLRFGSVLIAIGLIGIIYSAIKFRINRPVQFSVGFLCWLISSFLINILIVFDYFQKFQMLVVINPSGSTRVDRIGRIIDISHVLEIGMITALIVIQLLGYSLAFLAFRKDKGWIGVGIIFASILYLVGSIISSGCNPVGLPFPISLVSFC